MASNASIQCFDCVAGGDKPLPLATQVAYQRGTAIAYYLKAIAEGKDPQSARVNLRGTLLKLEFGESAANLTDRFEITGKLGHLIGRGTYLQLLPTPVHNFKISLEWLTDEIFYRYMKPKPPSRVFRWAGGALAAVVLTSSGLLI